MSMDQEAFRKLLSVSKQGSSQHTPTARGPLLPSKAKDDQKKSAESSKAAFKPRKIKKQTDSNYRDRAAERRTGAAGDFAEVESVLDTFEKQHANDENKEAVEEQRRYLGGDSEHTVLVKGLDFALLEQTKARVAASTSVEDDEELEQAFHGAISASPPASAQTTTSKKRTREDIVRELKNKRAKGDADGATAPASIEDKPLEEAKREGKFKPIGFKPIGSSKVKETKEVKKKKKRKVVENEAAEGSLASSGATAPPVEDRVKKEDVSTLSTAQNSDKKLSMLEPELETVDEDFDIFAGAGEYEGVNFDDDDDDGDNTSKRVTQDSETLVLDTVDSTQVDEESSEAHRRRKWVDDGEPPSPSLERPLPSLADARGKRKDNSASPNDDTIRGQAKETGEINDETPPEGVARLAPLASSAIPSIRDILAADSALETEKKRKARKEKRKGGGGGGVGGEGKKVSAEAKLNRDYQKLKSFTDKKSSS